MLKIEAKSFEDGSQNIYKDTESNLGPLLASKFEIVQKQGSFFPIKKTKVRDCCTFNAKSSIDDLQNINSVGCLWYTMVKIQSGLFFFVGTNCKPSQSL